MKRTFAEAMAHRRSYYSIGSDSPVLDEEIVHIIREARKECAVSFQFTVYKNCIVAGRRT